MAAAVVDNGGGKYSLLCSRCSAEINPIVIEGDDDTVLPLSRNSDASNGLVVGSRKRKRKYKNDDRNGYDDDAVEMVKKEDDPQGTRWMSFSQVAEMIKESIRRSSLPKKEGSIILDLMAALEKKPNLKPLKEKVVKSSKLHPKTGVEIERLLRGQDKNWVEPEMEWDTEEVVDEDIEEHKKKFMEEDRHPWITPKKNGQEALPVRGGSPAAAAPKILMRVWDDRSQARIREGSEGFLSCSNYMPLHTKEQRKSAIENHANWKNRQKTAFISATTDIQDIAECLVPRLERRQNRNGLLSITKITLINGNADGMPILPIRKELDFYKCRIPYETSKSTLKKIARIEKCRREGKKMPKMVRKSWYNTEYVFLFRIPTEQIVKTWLWKDVEQWLIDNKTEDIQRWYQEVLVPAYNRHEHSRTSGSVDSNHEPNCTCCGH